MKSVADVLEVASRHLHGLPGHVFDVLEVSRPASPEAAANLAKVISKLSPLVGNMIEFNTCEFLNGQDEFRDVGEWKRQDPGFPDTVFVGDFKPTPGFEIKAWFPLATEITARFKDSQNHFLEGQTHVAMLAWLPEFIIFGRPKIIDLVIVPGMSVAKARDDHYHNPPDYLVLEPEDTSLRTRNLQQTNTSGYKWQRSEAPGREAELLKEAEALVDSWGDQGRRYSSQPEYQAKVRELLGKYTYRLDTNFAKMDRIVHAEIEDFKRRVLSSVIHGMKVSEWASLLSSGSDELIQKTLIVNLGLSDTDEAVVK